MQRKLCILVASFCATLCSLVVARGYAHVPDAAPSAVPTPSVVPTPSAVPLVGSPDSLVQLDGTSTLHAFSAKAKGVRVVGSTAPVPGVASPNDVLAAAVRGGQPFTLEVTVPVAFLESGDSGLDDHMHAALKGDAYPNIVFRLESYAATPDAATPGTFGVRAKGTLSIAGTAKPLALATTATALKDGQLRVSGSTDLRMTDFAIAPPTFFLGTLRAGDQVAIHFDIVIKASPKSSLSN
jgi:hypothetical protein